jgi:hypothetical protein
MADGIAKPAIEAVQILTGQIDDTVEGILDSHGFTFLGIGATLVEATARFSILESAGDPAWHLTLRRTVAGDMTADLERTADARTIFRLAILVDGKEIRDLAAAVGLAVSFTTYLGQVRGEA